MEQYQCICGYFKRNWITPTRHHHRNTTEARRHCTMEQLTGQNFSILSVFNSKLRDTNFLNLILILPEVHILYVTSQK